MVVMVAEMIEMDSVVIKSAKSSATLTFCDGDGDYFSVLFQSPVINVKKRVWCTADCEHLVNLFKFIASEWKGWPGAKEWESLKMEFGISATCDNLGHIMLNLSFNDMEWQAGVEFELDSGQTERIAREVDGFFGN